MEHRIPSYRPAAGLLVLLLLALGLSAALSPHLFNLLVRLARHLSSGESLRNVEFDRLFRRCVVIVFILGLWPILKWSGMAAGERLGWKPVRGAGRLVIRGWMTGVVILSLIMGAGWVVGVFSLNDLSFSGFCARAGWALFGGLLVGLVEEFLFRGVLFGGLRTALGFWGAAGLSSAIYALAHFIKPSSATGVVYGHWYTGFALLQNAFHVAGSNRALFPSAITLFLLGLALCLLFERYRVLYFNIGLHSGLVWVVQVGLDLFAKTDHHLDALFGPGVSLVKSPLALVVALALCAMLASTRKRDNAGAPLNTEENRR